MMHARLRRPSMLPLACGLLLGALSPRSAAAYDRGAQIAAACSGCHVPDGTAGGIPVVAGMPAAAIEQAMLAYRSGRRSSQIMQVVAQALSPEEIATVARFLANPPGAGTHP